MISWKLVLYNHVGVEFGGTMFDFNEEAYCLGYPYFCWNDRIYSTETGKDTGMTIEDIK